jgi:hypothetical protein
MANTNTLTNAVQQLLAQGLLALREMAVMPRFVNRAYETLAGEKMSTIDINIPSAITATEVSPSYVPPDDSGVVPTKVSIALDQWWEAPFFLNDKEMLEVVGGTIPMQASEAVKSLANKVDGHLLALYKQVYNKVGTAGTTPFSNDLTEFLDADEALNNTLAPPDNRYVCINPKAKANAMALRAFQDASYRGDTAGILRGDIGEKLGAFWFMDQNVPTHTAGTAVGATTDATGYAIGATGVTLASAGTGTILVGDIVTFAGDTQQYTVITATGCDDVSDGGSFTFQPALKVAIETSTHAITVDSVSDTYKTNLMFHRDSFALVSRPFAAADPMGLGTFQSAVDPVSGLALRLEVTRQHKRTRFSYDILYGVKCIRPELACRIAGE